MNTHLNRMLFSRAFVKVSACVVLSAGCLPMAAYAESVEAPVVESVLQQKAISGKVVDSKGESIIGANIMEKGTTNGTITDFDGNFSLNVAANDDAGFFQVREIPLIRNFHKGQYLMPIRMKETNKMPQLVQNPYYN